MKKKENRILKYVKEHKILVSVLSLIVVLLITGTTLAIFLVSGVGTDKTYTLGNVDVKYIDGNTFKVDNSIPLADYEIEEYAAKKEFSFENKGNITMYAEVLLTEIEISDNLINKDFVWELYEKDDSDEYTEISNGNFAEIKDNKISLKKGIEVTVGVAPKNYKILVYIKDNGGDQNDMMTSHMSCKVTVTATDKPTEYVDNSGANPPKLADGMIPVTYDEESDAWVKADLYNKWYDYDDGMWANVVTVNKEASTCEEDDCIDEIEKKSRNDYILAPSGTSISMDDINTMWVWIPRYKYRIPSDNGISTDIPPEIDVVFETGLATTGVSEKEYRNTITDTGTVANNIYYTHPAFRNISSIQYDEKSLSRGGWDHELTGIWIGKFETGSDNDLCSKTPNANNCKEVEPIIKPNIQSLRYQNVSTQFKTSLKFGNGKLEETTGKVTFSSDLNNKYGLNEENNNIDSHMTKSIEWGSVAYLSQSKYGKMGNENYIKRDKEIYRNNSSSFYTGRSVGAIVNDINSAGTYSYNDKKCLSDDIVLCTGSKETNKGTGASTTGTIYGIYDMAGGTYEYVMGNYTNIVSNSGFNVLPEKKYYDFYNTTTISQSFILGDSTWETKGWYGDYQTYDNWPVNGGYYNDQIGWAGIFNSWNSDRRGGSSDFHLTFRTTLINN